MGPNPILRLGGASQDKLEVAPSPYVWKALKTLHSTARVRYIIGLPLAQKNALALSKKMITDTMSYLPPQAVFAFELGNEPEFWVPYGLGGWTPQGTWVKGFPGYAPYFHRMAQALNTLIIQEAQRLKLPSYKRPLLQGPGWGNVNTQDLAWTSQVLRGGVGRGTSADPNYLLEATVHYYPYVDNRTITVEGLLDQDLLNFGLLKFNEVIKVAKFSGLPIRITEANSLYGGGRKGLSDTMAGALWCTDALLSFANAGAAGFHFHWGNGGLPKQGGQPNTGVQTNFDRNNVPYPSIHAPWFGYLFFKDASAGSWDAFSDTAFLPVLPSKGSCKGNVKVWALLSAKGELRMVLLNKDMDTNCNMKVVVPGMYCATATLARLLPGTLGMRSEAVTYKGQRYLDGSGAIKGEPVTFKVGPQKEQGGSCSFNVPMPAASGALLRVDKQVKVARDKGEAKAADAVAASRRKSLPAVPVALHGNVASGGKRPGASLRKPEQQRGRRLSVVLRSCWKAVFGM